MGLDVTVTVATFGTNEWAELAWHRAVPSAVAQGVPVVHVHGATLHGARNAALQRVETKWSVALDADDELEPGYIKTLSDGWADVRAPAVRYVKGSQVGTPRMPRVAGHTHDCVAECLLAGNWLVVGSMVRAQLVRDVGGWRDFTWSEDWDLWLRCHLAGASFQPVPEAVYRAHVRHNSRNRGEQRQPAKLAAHRAIAAANGVPAP